MGAQKGLSEEQKFFFESEGYLIIPDFASDEECTTLIGRMEQLVEAFDPTDVSIFSTKNQKKYMDKYFDDSASNISFFFEGKENGLFCKAVLFYLNDPS
jgi:phytanoyl-CoA hydroxylase